MAKRKLTKAERAEMEARHERMLANAQRLRELAEKEALAAQADANGAVTSRPLDAVGEAGA